MTCVLDQKREIFVCTLRDEISLNTNSCSKQHFSDKNLSKKSVKIWKYVSHGIYFFPFLNNAMRYKPSRDLNISVANSCSPRHVIFIFSRALFRYFLSTLWSLYQLYNCKKNYYVFKIFFFPNRFTRLIHPNLYHVYFLKLWVVWDVRIHYALLKDKPICVSARWHHNIVMQKINQEIK